MTTEEYRAKLQHMQKEMRTRIDAIHNDFLHGRSADFSEQATEQENQEVLVQLKHDAEIELREINVALKKIETGNFGECDTCGEEIAQGRLQAIPYTPYCINCA